MRCYCVLLAILSKISISQKKMPKELCHLLRDFEFLAEDTASLQGALEISQTFFNYSPDKWNQEPLACRSTYSKCTTVDSKPAPSCVPGTYLFSMASGLKIFWLYPVDHMSGMFPTTDITFFHCNSNFILLTFLRNSYWWPQQQIVQYRTCIYVFMHMDADMNHNGVLNSAI